MNLEIRKLTTDLLGDWLNFFDNHAFSDTDSWPCCYCMHFHWDAELESNSDWNASLKQVYRETGVADNRERAINLIKNGTMQGYLAYSSGEVVGWCNANDKRKYNTVRDSFFDDTHQDRKVKSVVCFVISPKARGQGVATKLLEEVCAHAAEDGYECIEAYPLCHKRYGAVTFKGSVSMFEKLGFENSGQVMDDCFILRKNLT